MDNKELLRRLALLKANPKLADTLPQGEILGYITELITAFNILKKAIETNKIKGEDGYTPKEGKDYHSKAQIEQMVYSVLNQGLTEYEQSANALLTKLEKRVETIKDGKDAEITEELKEEVAEMCRALIDLPDFEALIDERITANPFAIRDSLELIPEEKDKLKIEAIGYLRAELDDLSRRIATSKVGGLGGVSEARVRQLIVELGGGGTGSGIVESVVAGTGISVDSTDPANPVISATGGGVSVEVPTGLVDSSNVTFTFTAAPKIIVTDTGTYVNEALMQNPGMSGFTLAGLVATLALPPNYFCIGYY